MKINVYSSVDEVLEKLAAYIIDAANESIKDHGRFTIALSGGSSPEKLYGLLASASFSDKTDWTKAYFFLGDERYVPETDPASNYKMIKRVFFGPLNIQKSQIFPIDTSLAPEDAATAYMNDINSHFSGAPLRFDLILLGLGDNSHTASLFPFTNILYDKTPGIKSVFLTDQQVYRITFNAPLINMAHHIAFLVFGEGKAQAVHNVIEGELDTENFPAQLIHPSEGTTDWFLDEAAAAKTTFPETPENQ